MPTLKKPNSVSQFFCECRVTLPQPGCSHSPQNNQSEVLLPHLQWYKYHKSRDLRQIMNLVSLQQLASLSYHPLVFEKFLQHSLGSDLSHWVLPGLRETPRVFMWMEMQCRAGRWFTSPSFRSKEGRECLVQPERLFSTWEAHQSNDHHQECLNASSSAQPWCSLS